MATKKEAILEDAVSQEANHCLKEETMVVPETKSSQENSSNHQDDLQKVTPRVGPGQKRKNSQRFEKGIVSSTRPQNLTNHGGWRPKPINFRKMDPSKQLSVNGCQLTLRQCRSFVMFEIETFTGKNNISKCSLFQSRKQILPKNHCPKEKMLRDSGGGTSRILESRKGVKPDFCLLEFSYYRKHLCI